LSHQNSMWFGITFAQKTYSNSVGDVTFKKNESATDLLQAYSKSDDDRVAFKQLINESNLGGLFRLEIVLPQSRTPHESFTISSDKKQIRIVVTEKNLSSMFPDLES